MGRIGQAIARRGAHGFAMQVIYHNRSPLAAAAEADARRALRRRARRCCARPITWSSSFPYSAESHHLVGAAELALMKPTATLVNIARGGVVDDVGARRGAARRAASPPPASTSSRASRRSIRDLLACRNVVLTPHIASASLPTRRAMAALAADNLICLLDPGGGPRRRRRCSTRRRWRADCRSEPTGAPAGTDRSAPVRPPTIAAMRTPLAAWRAGVRWPLALIARRRRARRRDPALRSDRLAVPGRADPASARSRCSIAASSSAATARRARAFASA